MSEHLRARLAILVVVPTLAVGLSTPAFASGTTPTPQTLAAMKAEADDVQAKLTLGARTLEAARSELAALTTAAASARAGAASVAKELGVLRDQLGGYAAELYVHPAAQSAIVALTDGPDLATSMQGVEMLSILNRGRGDVLNEVVVDEQRADALQTQAAQAVAAAARVQTSITEQVSALQVESAQAATRLTAAQAAYQAALARAEVARLTAEKAARDRQLARDVAAARDRAARDQAARALAAQRAADAADAGGGTGSVAECGAASAGGYPAGAWGGYSDGLIPSSQLCAISGGGRLRPDAAAAFDAMSQAYAQAFGTTLCVSDSYRTYSQQVSVFRQRPSLAAVPGTSNHGWGLAVDLGCGVQNSRSAQYRWMTRNAGQFGWVHPAWAVHDPYEPWHWEFGHLAGAGGT